MPYSEFLPRFFFFFFFFCSSYLTLFGVTRFSQLPSPRPSKKQKSSRGQRGEEDEEDEVGGCCLLDKQSADCGGRLISALRSGRFPLDSSPSPSSLLRCVFPRKKEKKKKRKRQSHNNSPISCMAWRGVAWRGAPKVEKERRSTNMSTCRIVAVVVAAVFIVHSSQFSSVDKMKRIGIATTTTTTTTMTVDCYRLAQLSSVQY